MSWLWGAALLPLILCGGMCIGGMVLAAIGLGRARRQGSEHHERTDGERSPR
jgi:hypothetical protein